MSTQLTSADHNGATMGASAGVYALLSARLATFIMVTFPDLRSIITNSEYLVCLIDFIELSLFRIGRK